jgi:hypothetical protein
MLISRYYIELAGPIAATDFIEIRPHNPRPWISNERGDVIIPAGRIRPEQLIRDSSHMTHDQIMHRISQKRMRKGSRHHFRNQHERESMLLRNEGPDTPVDEGISAFVE